MDRRISRGFNTVEVDPVLVGEILRLYLEEERLRGPPFSFAFISFDSISWLLARYHIDQTKEKAVTRLAVTYGILRRLGFSEDSVEQCLRTISGIELDEALDWVSPDTRTIPLSRLHTISLLSTALETNSK